MRKIMLLSILISSILAASCEAAMPVTSSFGWRNDPITGEWKFHAGVDLGYEYGATIPALFDGVVVSAGDNNDGYGICVLLYHPDRDVYTRYGHCAAVYVTPGQTIQAGDIIGLIGSTGRSTGPHLHLEYIVDTADGYQYTDPLILWQA